MPEPEALPTPEDSRPCADAPTEPPRELPGSDLPTVPPETAGARPGGPPPLRERRIAGYDLLERIGEGGMGVVYRARHLGLGKEVAVKLLESGTEREIARFIHEARALAELSHPNIVPVHDVGEAASTWYLAMELAPGTLVGLIRDGAGRRASPREPVVPVERALAIVEKIALGIAHAHEHGIIHRDLKPSNVLLRANGEPLVADFGLARRVDTPQGLTRTGQVLGTPAYMAPEQAQGSHSVDERGDVYAIGAILYELLTGKPPVATTGNLASDLYAVMTAEPPPPRRLVPSLPRDVETVVLHALERSPGRRYPTARALAEDIRRYRAGEPILARPPSLLGRLVRAAVRRRVPLSIATLALLALGALLLLYADYAAQRRSWATVFESAGPSFDISRWRSIDGSWQVAGGALRSSGGRPARIALDAPLAGDVRIEYTARIEPHPGRRWSDLSTAIVPRDLPDEAYGYFFGFGSDENTASKILRHGRCVARVAGAAATITPGRDFRVRVERAAGELRLEVDGRELLTYRDPCPLAGVGRAAEILLYTWDADAEFRDVRVYHRPEARTERREDVAGWLLERGEPQGAALLYADLAADPALPAAERQMATLRRGVAELAALAERAPDDPSRPARLARSEEALLSAAGTACSREMRLEAELGLAEVDLARDAVAPALARARGALALGPFAREAVRDFLGRTEAALASRGAHAARLDVLHETRRLFCADGDRMLEMELGLAEAKSLEELGRVGEAVAILGAAADRAGRDDPLLPSLLIDMGYAELRRGSPSGARDALRRAASAARGDPLWTVEIDVARVEVELDAGELAAARDAAAEASRAAGEGEEEPMLAAEVARGRVALAMAEATGAAASQRELLDRLDEISRLSLDARRPASFRVTGVSAALAAATSRLVHGDDGAAQRGLDAAAVAAGPPPWAPCAWAELLAALLDARAGKEALARARLDLLDRTGARWLALHRTTRAIEKGPPSRDEVQAILSATGDARADRALAALALGLDALAGGRAEDARRLLGLAAAEAGGPYFARAIAREELETAQR